MELRFDYTTSVRKALDEIDRNWRDYDGLIVCGTHSPDLFKAEKTINELREARERGKPTLGICFGYQLMAIEFARNVLSISGATSEEFGYGDDFVVKKLPELKVGLHDGESYWNDYEVDSSIVMQMDKDLFNDKYYGVQYHPEYQSSKEKPHKVLVNFLETCKKYSAE